jgi:RNA polymerase sigma factor (TIGR02999 family)
MPASQPDITTLLSRASQGDQDAQDGLFRLVEGELRKRARAYLRHERPSHALQTTVLVDEAFLRLVGDHEVTWENRRHFYCFAANVMRTILVDDARMRHAEKRGGHEAIASLHEVAEPAMPPTADPLTLLVLHEALERLALTHPELIQIVELHHFAGWELKQIAEDVLRLPYQTVKRQWQRAKALLHREMCGADHDGPRDPPPS